METEFELVCAMIMMVAGTTVNTAYWKLYPSPPPDKSQEFRVCLYVYATYFILAVNIINPHGKKTKKNRKILNSVWATFFQRKRASSVLVVAWNHNNKLNPLNWGSST
jgi:hypothetical protein